MKKLLLIFITIFALSSCKEKDELNWNHPKFSPTAVWECLDNSGMIIYVKSDIPSNFFLVTAIPEGEKIETQEDIVKHHFYETENDIYKIVQIDEYTFQITIKPFVEDRRVVFYFSSKENPSANCAYIIITCGFNLEDRPKEYFEKYYSWK